MNSNSDSSFTAFSEMENNEAFDINRPESIDLFNPDVIKINNPSNQGFQFQEIVSRRNSRKNVKK